MNTETDYWSLIHAERARLADALSGLSEDDWSRNTLCADWSVEEVVAHLTAAANTGTLAWIRSMVLAGFKPDRHNRRRLVEFKGDTPAETLNIYRESIESTKAPTKDYGAWLGEVIVHGQDIAHPLELTLNPDPGAVIEVARYFANKDFAVNSKSLVAGLTLEATDAEFRTGDGPLVSGKLLALVMAMAGRDAFLNELEGDGGAELRTRMDT